MARLKIKKLSVDLDFTSPEPTNEQGIKRSLDQIKSIIPFAKPLYKHFILLAIFSTISALLGMVMPFTPKIIIDEGVAKGDFRLIVIVIIAASSISAFEHLLNWFIGLYNEYLSKYISFKTTYQFIKKFKNLDEEFIGSQRTGDIVDRMSGLQDGILLISDFINRICTMLVRLSIIPAAVAIMDWRVAVFGLPMMIVVTIGWYYLQRYLRSYNVSHMRFSGLLDSSLFEMISSIQDIRMAGQFNRVFLCYMKEYVNVWKRSMVIYLISSSFNFLQNILVVIMTFVLSIFGWHQVVIGAWTLGKMATIMVALGYIVAPFQSLFEMGGNLVNTSVSIERFFEVFNAKEIQHKNGLKVDERVSEISLKNISFSYVNGPTLIEGLDLYLDKGSITVLTGDSGSGKSTLLKIISGLLSPKYGEIIINQIPSSLLDSQSWLSSISLLSQNPFFMRGTLEENILFGSENTKNYKKMLKMFKLEDVEKRIGKRNLDEGAKNLSSGEKQRIALCRMLIKQKPVLLLDEPLSQVDMPTVNLIFRNIIPILKESVCLIVTHNPLIWNFADKTYFLYHGRLYDNKDREKQYVL